MVRRFAFSLLALLAAGTSADARMGPAKPLSDVDCAALGPVVQQTSFGLALKGAYISDYPAVPEGTVFNPPLPPPPSQAALAASLRRMLPSLTVPASMDYAGEIGRLRSEPYKVRCDWARYGRDYWESQAIFEGEPGWKLIPGAPPPPPPAASENSIQVDRPVYRRDGRYALVSLQSFPMGGTYEGIICQLRRRGPGWRVMACGVKSAQ